jgi:hypothetical protein
MNIFFSYPHDDNASFVKRLKQDLESRGHTVWFDEAEIKTGDDWRSKITRGNLDSQAVVAFLSKHSVHDPGVCLNEIAIAMADKGDEAIVRVLLEPETCTLAPFHNSVREWLSSETAGNFRIFPKKTLYALTEATWRRYSQRKEDDVRLPCCSSRRDKHRSDSLHFSSASGRLARLSGCVIDSERAPDA